MVESDPTGLVGVETTIFELVIADTAREGEQSLKDWLSLPLTLRSNMGDGRAKAIDLQTMGRGQIVPLLWDMVGDLVDAVLREASVQKRELWLKKPLECAVRSSNPDLVTRLLALDGLALRVGGIRDCEVKPSTLLLMAINSAVVHRKGDDPSLVKVLLENGARTDIDRSAWGLYSDDLSWTSSKEVNQAPLHRAVYSGFLRVSQALIGAGASFDAFDSEGLTPLSIAFEQKRDEIALYLLSCGAFPNVETGKGIPVLQLAVTAKAASQLVPTILRAGAEVNTASSNGQTALHVACASGTTMTLVAVLVTAGADMNATDENGDTPLMMACRYCTANVVAYLLEKGADDTLSNRHGLVAGVEESLLPGESIGRKRRGWGSQECLSAVVG